MKLPARHDAGSGHRRLAGFALLALLLIGFAVAWRFTPLAEWLDVDRLLATARDIRSLPAAPLWLLAMFVVGSLVVVPLTLMVVVTVVAVGAVQGFFYALAGSMAASLATYAIGHYLGRDNVEKLVGERFRRVNEAIGRHGIGTVAVLRIVPVAPFTIVNVGIGASNIRFRDFVIGSLVGLVPGLLAMTLFLDRFIAMIRNPEPMTFGLFTAVTLAVVAGFWWLKRILQHRRSGEATAQT